MQTQKEHSIRKRVGITALLIAVVLLLFAGVWREVKLQQAQQDLLSMLELNAGNYNEDRVVLSPTNRREAQEIAETFGGTLRITNDGLFAVIRLPDGITLHEIAQNDAYRKYHDRICLDYKNFSVGTEETDVAAEGDIRANFQSDEPMYPQQTYLDYINIGDSWNVSMGKNPDGEKVTVAIIDSGIDTDHPEFKDADGKSIISNLSYDATDDKIVKTHGIRVIDDENGHGTAVAGVIAAQINGEGIMGIAPDVEILVIKCDVNEAGEFKSSADIIFGIYYAIEQDVDVINMSLGSNQYPPNIEKALQLAADSDIITVAAAGNDSTANEHYPAALENTIGVGALAENSWELAEYSNFGDNSDILAPGTILTASMGGGYVKENGTSMAAPVVSAAVAIYKSQHPYATYQEVKNDLLAAGKDLGEPGNDMYYAFGALNMNAFICEEKGTITYDYCTEDLEETSQVFVKQHTIQTVPEPERENIIFDDWYYDKGYTRVFDYDAWYTTEFVEDVTLYAKWVNEDDEGASVYSYKTLSDGTIEITSYKGKRRYLTIPDEIDGKTVSAIGIQAFSGNTRLREITFPKGLRKIRDYAFSDVTGLRMVTFAGNILESIGEGAFNNCTALRMLELPDSVVTIGAKAFINCSTLSEIKISNTSSLAVLDDEAFSKTGLSYLYLPQGVTGFNGSVLAYCRNMRSVDLHPGNEKFEVRNGMVLSADGTKLIYYPAALTGSLTVPDGVLTIADYACTASAISRVVLPESLQQIGKLSFPDSRITDLTIPSNVKKIDKGAFKKCTLLANLTFAEDSMLRIIDGDAICGGAFEDCKQLVNLELPESLEFLGDYSFYGCRRIPALVVPTNVSYLGESSFENCYDLQIVTFDENCVLTKISDSAFSNCANLHSVKFSDRIQTLGNDVFSHNYLLTKLTFGSDSGLRTVGDQCFYSCEDLTQMQLPESVTSIGKLAYAFSGLTSVHVPVNLTSIGDGAFGACHVLTHITVDADHAVYTAIDNVLFDKNVTTVYCVPASRVGCYTLPVTVQITAPYSFYYDRHLTEVILPDGLMDIQHDSFYCCTSLRSISIPSTVTNIGRMGFYSCRSLQKVTFSENSQLQRLGLYTFVSCGMKHITIPASVESMAQYVFNNCSKLKRITFEAGSRLSYVAAYLLAGTNVESVVFENGSALTHLQAHAFDGAKQLKSVDFGDAPLEVIDNYAFYDCTELEQLSIPSTVTYLGRYAFYGCGELIRFDISDAMDYIGISAFGGTNAKVFFEADVLPANVQEDWDMGIAGYFLAAKEYVVTDDWEYLITVHDTVALSRYLGPAASLTIDSVDGRTVEKIGAGCFADNNMLSEVILSADIREIDNYAFQNSTAVVTIPEDSALVKIGSYAFRGNATERLTLPDTVTHIGIGAFEASGLKKLVIGENSSLCTIGDRAFCESEIESIFLPASLETVGVDAFRNVLSLSDVIIAEGDTPLKLSNSAFENSGIKKISIPKRVYYIGEYALGSCPNLEGILVDDGNTVYQDMDGILLDISGTTLIQYPCGRAGAFEIPAQITVLNYASFKNAKNLTDVTFADGCIVRTIGWQTFSGCESLTRIVVPDTVISFDFYAFENCTSLTDVVLGTENQLTGVYEGALYGCSALTGLSLPDTVVDIGDYAFYGCSGLTEFPLTENAQTKSIGAHAFDGCIGLSEIPKLDYLSYLGDYAFAYTSISEFTASAALKNIGEAVFYSCENLMHISCDEANENFTAIDGALYEKGVSQADDYESMVAWPYGKVLIIGEGKTEVTAADTEFMRNGVFGNWAFADSVTVIGPGAFYNHKHLKSIPLTENITTIGKNAFYGCISLEELTIPKNVTSLGEYMICGCKKLRQINFEATAMPDLPENNYVFYSYSNMFFDVTFAAGVTQIPANLFCPVATYQPGCGQAAVRSIHLEEESQCRRIGDYAFGYCFGLEEISIPENVTTIGVGAFTYCTALEKIQFNAISMNDLDGSPMNKVFYAAGVKGDGIHLSVGPQVTRIPAQLFFPNGSSDNHPKVVSVVFEENSVCTSIGEYAFWACEELAYVKLPSTITEIGKSAFTLCYKAFLSFDSEQLPLTLGQDWSGAAALLMKEDKYGITENGLMYYIDEDGNARVGAYLGNAEVVDIPRYINGAQVVEILRGTFRYCTKLREVTIPKGVRSIGAYAFSSCNKLEKVHLPTTLEIIGVNAFSYCYDMERIDIPRSVYSIGTEAFFNCSHLMIVFESDELPASLGSSWSYSCVYALAPQKFGETEDGFCYWINLDNTASLWRYLGKDDVVIIPETAEGIPVAQLDGKMFYENESIRKVILPDALKKINSYTFYKCASLEEVAWNEGLEYIGDDAFAYCESLETAVLPDSVKVIGTRGFNSCKVLKKVIIPSGVEIMGSYVFGDCKNLKTAGPIAGGFDIEFGWTEAIPDYAFSSAEITAVTLPEGITHIGKYAFSSCDSMKEVVIPESVTSIGSNVFQYCDGITTMTIPERVTTIGKYAFSLRNLVELRFNAVEADNLKWDSGIFAYAGKNTDGVTVYIGERVACIPEYLFSANSNFEPLKFREIIFESEDNLKEIGQNAFEGNKTLNSIRIPASIQRIGNNAFYGCSNLKQVQIDSPMVLFTSNSKYVNGYLLNAAQTVIVPEQIQPNTFFSSTYPTVDTIAINGESYTAYSLHAHGWSEGEILSDWVACTSDGVTRYTCNDCGLVNEIVTDAHELTEHIVTQQTCLEDGSAYSVCNRCGLRTDYTLHARGAHDYGNWYTIEPATETTDGVSQRDCADCGQYETAQFATMASGKTGPSVYWVLTEKGYLWIFGEGQMQEYTSSSQVPWYSYASKIVTVEIGENVTNIPGYAFYQCRKLTEVTIPGTVTSIGKYAFYNCSSLKIVQLPDSLMEFDDNAFTGCSALSAIRIPENITYISNGAFSGCSALTEVAFPEKLTTIGPYAFQNCKNLAVISLPPAVKEIGHAAFQGCTKLVLFELDENNTYFRLVDGILYSWDFSTLVLCPASVQGDLIIPYGVVNISNYAFVGCTGLNTIVLPESVTNLGEYAFYECRNLKTIKLPDSLRSVGRGAFYYCSNLTSLVVPDGITQIPEYMCYYCTNLSEVILPDGITSIGSYVFYNCTALESVVLPVSLESIPSGLFQYCGKLTSITLPEKITSIGSSAFAYCTALRNVTFTGNAPKINSGAFSSVTADVFYPAQNDSWTESVRTNYGGTLTWYSKCADHTWGAWNVKRTATCTEDGENRRNCTKCSCFETEVIPATGHSYEHTATAPTCTAKGFTTHTCINCGDSYVDTQVDALGHDMGEWTTVSEATCTEDGSERRDCSRCDHYETHTIEATGHSFGTWFVNHAATCTRDGENRRNCNNCSHYETELIHATGHSYEHVVTAPTCSAKGFTTHTCVNCGNSYVDTHVDALGHDMGEWTTVTEVTCTEDGSERRGCSRCDHYETRMIKATGHNYGHTLTAPTCTAKGFTTHTCVNCGDSYVDTYVDALDHDMSEWITVTEATCTEDGSERRDCSRCEQYETRTIEATGHSFGTWFVNHAATCTEDGESRRNCINCSYYETEVIPTTGHSYQSILTAPTCTDQGYTTHTCSSCGDSYVDTYVDALGHDMSEWITVTEATCTEDGSERRDCSRCDHYETRMIKATGHSYGHTLTAPTCTAKGFTTHTCVNCGDSYVDTHVDALGHDMSEWTTVSEATCTEDGSERRGCSRCDQYETRTIEATGHSFGTWFVSYAATCTEDGESRRNCNNCSYYEKEVILATGHSYEHVVTAPTCSAKGFTTHTCINCGNSYVDTHVDALGHDMGEWTTVTEATCTEDGSEHRDCTRCDHYETRTIKATGHSFGDWFVNHAATCTGDGENRRNCNNCSHYEIEVIPAMGHSYQSVVTAPTCMEKGYTTHTCFACGDSYVDTYLDALGHDMGEWTTVTEATCTEDGQELRECVRCDLYETRIIDAFGHSYETIVTAPTCTEQGYTRYVCSVCGVSFISDYMAPTGHKYDEVVTEPTCTESGYTTYTCYCGDSFIGDYTEALGHDMSAWETATKAACTENGEEIRECIRCDHSESRVIEALGHYWNEGIVTVEPTEETVGEVTYTCFRCSETRTEVIPELEHEHHYEAVVTEPTCTDRGYTTHTCRCGDSYVDSYVDALGHDMGEWFAVTEATCTADGMEQCDCSCCDYHETRVIEATGHDYESVVTDSTCIAQGFTTYTCVNCGDSYNDSYTAALGHSFTEYASDGNATCTQDGTMTSVCDRCDATDTVIYEGSAYGHEFTEWSVVQKPTETAEGLESRQCLRCGIEEIRTVACLVNPFGDVPSDSFYYEPVMWAVEKGITNGTSATNFGPNDKCMRAHVVTFLWRAVGSPEPAQTDNPFVDVNPTDFYYKPVLWALENGITSGMDATHFVPTSYCNRAQVVTFLYRTMGSPALESTDNPFGDVQAGAFYEKPVLWAVENGITNGLSATAFGPNTVCNRAQIVTFLYRAFVT